MEIALSFIVGCITGVVNNEQVYRQSRRFPHSRPMQGFFIRLLLTGAVALIVVDRFGANALLPFLGGNALARLLHTLLRSRVVVRY